MRNLERAITLATILIFITSATIPPASSYSVGVKNGDWVEYDITEFSEEHTERIEFMNVAGAALTLNITDTAASGLTFSPEFVNINFTTLDDSSAGLNFLNARVLIIPSNTNVGDSVYLGTEFGNTTIKILGETTRNYLEVDRLVIYANFSLPPLQKQYTLYWDKQTGVLVEATMSYGYVSSSLVISDTDLWIGGIGWWFWIIIVIVILGGILSTRTKTLRKLWRKTQAPKETTAKQSINP